MDKTRWESSFFSSEFTYQYDEWFCYLVKKVRHDCEKKNPHEMVFTCLKSIKN